MIRQFLSKVKESVASVLPVSIIVLILSLTPLVNLGDNKVTYIITFVVVFMSQLCYVLIFLKFKSKKGDSGVNCFNDL